MHKKLKGLLTDKGFWISTFIILSVIFILVVDIINDFQYVIIDFDGAYNATVSANLMRHGEYKVSYPDDIIFYNMITTGQLVLVPTAVIYKLFGINEITTVIVPMIYGSLSIMATAVFLETCLFEKKEKKTFIVASILAVVLLISDGFFTYIMSHLIGEGAAFFFLLLSFIFLCLFFDNKKNIYVCISGVFLACSFLTKSSMIFFVVSCFGIFLIESIVCKTITMKQVIYYYVGFGLGFILVDSFKLVQLGGVSQYVSWWMAEWGNMLNQSSGVDVTYSIRDKINYLEAIFVGYNKYICIILILLPIVCYAYHVIKRFFKKETYTNGMLTVTIAGVAASSLLVYFVLLGGSGLVYARRHVVNELFLKIFMAYIVGQVIKKALEYINTDHKEKVEIFFGVIVLIGIVIITIYPIKVADSNIKSYIQKNEDDSYEARLMEGLLSEVTTLPSDSQLYCAGWWQEPRITVFLDRDMKSIFDVIYGGDVLSEKAYFIVGHYIDNVSKAELEMLLNAELVRVDSSEVDYNSCRIGFNRMDFELFAIYEIRPYVQ